ncbi:hypothetical protein D3C80_1292680 [compost metagenome]
MPKAFLQRTGQHALVEGRMKRQHRAVANEIEQVEQGLGRVATGGKGAGAQAMNQHAGVGLLQRPVQGAFELLGKIDGAVFDGHCANRQYLVPVGVEPAGFQVQHHPALFTQGAYPQRCGLGQPAQALACGGVQFGRAGAQPGEQAHSWYRRARLLCRRWAWRSASRRMRRSRWLRLSGSRRLE